MMNDWYQCMVDTLQLNGKGERTQQAYTRSVRMLAQFYDKTPDLVSEQELQDYFLHRKNVSHWSPKTMRICYCGIRFFYQKVLQRNWHILGILRAQTERRLPAVLSVDETRSLLSHVKTVHNYAYLSTVYSCGLRLHEGLHLEVSDIDSSRMMIHVHAARAPRIATYRCPSPLSISCAAIGSPTATPACSSRLSVETAKEPLRLKLPWPKKAVSKAPSAAPSWMPQS